jgi:hypothetical protein
MAYTSGRWNRIDKKHTCVGCGCVFRYAIDLRDPSLALQRSLTSNAKDLVATHPCPGCGLIQPEMVMWSKVCHPMTTLLAVVALLVFGLLGTVTGGPSPALCAQMALAAFATLALIHFATALANPNRNRDANLALAQKEVEAGRLEVLAEGSSDHQGRVPRNLTVGHCAALLLLLGPLAFLHPATALWEVPDPPTNPDLIPTIITPGERVSYTFPNVKAQGVTGRIWNGQPTVRVLNHKALGIPETLVAEGSNQSWGNKLVVPKGSRDRPLEVTIAFTVPKKEALAGKRLNLSITMTVKYPEIAMHATPWDSSFRFVNRSTTLRETLVVNLADQEVVQASRGTYLVGVGGGGVFLLGSLCLSLLAWMLRLRASPSEVLSAPPQEQDLFTPSFPVPLPPPDDHAIRSRVGPITFRRRPSNE